uniref:Uncharacterized protein n=1 Tax=Oryza meridionalis TaxID=40149 RepID=A0A0E0C079_9ORYZ
MVEIDYNGPCLMIPSPSTPPNKAPSASPAIQVPNVLTRRAIATTASHAPINNAAKRCYDYEGGCGSQTTEEEEATSTQWRRES